MQETGYYREVNCQTEVVRMLQIFTTPLILRELTVQLLYIVSSCVSYYYCAIKEVCVKSLERHHVSIIIWSHKISILIEGG